MLEGRNLTRQNPLLAKAVEGAALALEGVADVHGCDGLAAGVLRVGDGVADDGLQEGLEDRAGLLIDQAARGKEGKQSKSVTGPDGRSGQGDHVLRGLSLTQPQRAQRCA